MAKAGRRPGPTNTREEILAAARTRFAAQGYDATTVRAIATDAGVNPAMIHHYFGAKDRVFAAALAFPVDPDTLRDTVLEGPWEETGHRLAQLFVSHVGHPDTRAPFLALLRSVTSNEEAAATLREFLGSAIVTPISAALGVSKQYLEAAAAQLIGVVIVRHIVGVEPLASLPDDDVVALLSPAVQGHLDAGLDSESQRGKN